MAIYANEQMAILYQGDYAPAEMYADGKKVAGFVTQELTGREMSAEGTYRDVLDITLKGRYEQKQYRGYNLWNITDVSNDFDVVMHQHGIRSIYSVLPTSFKYIPLIDGSATSRDTAFHILSRVPVQMKANVEYSITFDYERKNCTGGYLQIGVNLNYGCNIRDIDENITSFRVKPLLGSSDVYSKGRTIGTVIAPNDGDFFIQIGVDSPDFYIADSASSEESFLLLENFMVTEGYVYGDIPAYEPYVGAMPSPNPQYPQEIIPLEQESLFVRSTNYCPPLKEWTLRDGAYLDDEGYISLPDEKSRAFIVIPWQTDGYRLCVFADTQKLTDDYSAFLLNTIYYDQNVVRITGNGNATEMTRTPSRYQMGFGSTSNNSIYAAAIHDAAYVYVEFTRGPTYGTRPYRFKNVSVADIACAEENKQFLLGRMPQRLVQQYQLFGSDGAFDTLEPCVMVDGEWKCRVTRRLRVYKYTGDEGIIYAGMKGRFYGYTSSYPGNAISQLKTNNGLRYITCDRLWGYTWNEANNTSAGFWGISARQDGENTYIRFFLGELSSLADATKWMAENQPTIVFPLAVPTVEYYDPIMLYTNPGSTIIKGNTDMVTRIKTIDHGTEKPQAVELEAEMPQTVEQQTDL